MRGHLAWRAMLRGEHVRRKCWDKGTWIRYDINTEEFYDEHNNKYTTTPYDMLEYNDWVIVHSKNKNIETRNVWENPRVGDVITVSDRQCTVVYVNYVSVVGEVEGGECRTWWRDEWYNQGTDGVLTLVRQSKGV